MIISGFYSHVSNRGRATQDGSSIVVVYFLTNVLGRYRGKDWKAVRFRCQLSGIPMIPCSSDL